MKNGIMFGTFVFMIGPGIVNHWEIVFGYVVNEVPARTDRDLVIEHHGMIIKRVPLTNYWEFIAPSSPAQGGYACVDCGERRCDVHHIKCSECDPPVRASRLGLP